MFHKLILLFIVVLFTVTSCSKQACYLCTKYHTLHQSVSDSVLLKTDELCEYSDEQLEAYLTAESDSNIVIVCEKFEK